MPWLWDRHLIKIHEDITVGHMRVDHVYKKTQQINQENFKRLLSKSKEGMLYNEMYISCHVGGKKLQKGPVILLCLFTTLNYPVFLKEIFW